MADRTEIAWCDSTFNPWIGCTKVGPGCDHCYAERDMDQRRGRVKWGAGQARSRTSADYWKQPLRWNRAPFFQCSRCGHRCDKAALPDFRCPACMVGWALQPARRRVFCASLADVFDNEAPQHWRTSLFGLIYDTPNLDWLLLTKRIGNAARMLADDPPEGIDMGSLKNLWLGATVVNQEEAERDIPKLLATPAAVRFVSIEPMLGHIMLLSRGFLRSRWNDGPGVDWVIAGGESGPGARPMQPEWARSLRDQCVQAGVPYLFKQWGSWGFAGKGAPRERMSKKAAGRLLDGVQHDGFPA